MKQSTSATPIITEKDAARELHRLRAVLDGGDDNAGPAETDQLPVMPRLQADGDVGGEIGFPPAATEGIRLARNAILLSLRLARAMGRDGIFYPRDRNVYSAHRHNAPDYWTYKNMRAAVDSMLARPDLVAENRARPQNPYALTFTGRRSVLFAGPAFVDAPVDNYWTAAEAVEQGQRILLRDGRKKAMAIPAGPTVDETQRFLALFDEAVGGLHFSFADPTIRWLSNTLAIGITDGWTVLINTDRRYLTRIFTRTMTDGGRFYRGFWQELPKSIRKTLLIDGAPTAEHDYAACHLRLSYFAVGAQLPNVGDGSPDHYTLDGFGPEWRSVIKKGVSILLNARTYVGAVGAIASLDEMPKRPWEQRVEMAVGVVAAIVRRHEPLVPLWHSGCGLGLQLIDSQLTVACATELVERGITPLPIHDSMLVRAEHLPELKEVMERRFEEDGLRLAVERFKAITKRKARGLRGHDLTQGRSAASVLLALSRGAPAPSSSVDVVVTPPSARAASPAAISTPSADGRPPDLAPLLADPTFKDFDLIIAHRRWVPGGLVRAALLAAMPFYPSRPAAVCAVRAWIVQTVAAWSATVDDARLTSEVARFIRRKTSPITPQGIARLCGVTAKMAVDLRLAVVIPPARKTSLSRRATRMAATLPRIIDIKDAAPWGDPRKRSSWYARHRDQADRQVLALSAILASGDVMKIAIARANVQRAARERALLPSKDRLPVDRLLARLRFRLMARDLGLSHLHHDPADGEIAHGDQTMVWSAKLFTLDYDAALEAALAMTSALSPVPKLQVRILNL